MHIKPETRKAGEEYPIQRVLALIVAFISVFGFFIKILFF